MNTTAICDLCGSSLHRKLFDGRDLLLDSPRRFEVLECRTCGLYTIRPRLTPAELSRFYPKGYVSFPQAVEDEKSWFRRWDRANGVRRRCQEVIRRAGKNGSILDVGCATGIFLNGMKQRGWTCYGVEPSSYAVQYARHRFNLDIFEGFIEQVDCPDGSFDVITLWDVFEHLPEPGRFLDRSWRLLKKGGWIVLTLPNADGWGRTFFGRYWAGWDVPRHFNIFSPQTIGRILQDHGFRVEAIKSFTGRQGMLVLDVQFLLSGWAMPQGIKEALLTLMRSLPVRILCYPFHTLAESLNKSSIMTAFARKISR